MRVERVREAPDGGWGWMCALGAAVVIYVTAGPPLTFSVIYQTLRDRYHGPPSLIAGVYITFTSTNMMLSPFVSALAKRFNCRVVAVIGGLLASSGMVIASLSGTLTGVYIGFGFMLGAGSSMIAMPTHITMNMYFKKRRARVMGLVSMMAGVAGLSMPTLLTYFLDTYGLQGSILLWAGIFAQGIVAASLYRPIEIIPTIDEEQLEIKKDNNEECEKSQGNIVKCLKNGEDMHDFNHKNPINGNSEGKMYHEAFGTENVPIMPSMNGNLDQSHKINHQAVNGLSTLHEIDRKAESLNGVDGIAYSDISAPQVRFYSRDEFGSAILCDDNEKSRKDFSELKATFLKYLDVTILKRSLFVSTAVSVGTIAIGLGVGNVYLSPFAAERGFSKSESAFLVSLRAGMFIVYQPLSGLTFDQRILRRYRVEMYATLNVLAGICTMMVPFARSKVSVYIAWLLNSLFMSWALAQETVVVAETVPPAKFPIALGLTRFCRGIFSLVGNTLAGIIVDYSGTYDNAYRCGGVCLLVPALALHLVCFLHRRKSSRQQDTPSNPTA